MYGMPDEPAGRRRQSVETFAPSETAGATVVSGAKAAEVQAEQQRKQAAASAAVAQGLDPNTAATAAIGTGQGGSVSPTGSGGAAAQAAAQAAAAAEAAAKQEAKERAEKEATIAASPLQANDVQVLRSDESGRSGAMKSPSDQLAQSLSDQMKASQAAADRQMERVVQMSTSFGGQSGNGGGTNAMAPLNRASQQDQWLASQKSDAGIATKMQPAPGMPIVSEGTPVRAVLLTGLDTDNPGRVKAMVTSDIYDTVTGRVLMIPKGSTLTGSYNHDVKVGQGRVLIAITRLIRPDGSWIDLSGTTGSELDGTSGLESDVNNHFWKIFSSAMVVGAATLLLDKSQQNVTVNQGLGTTQLGGTIFAQTLQQVVAGLLSRNKDIPPTLTRSGGTEFIFMVRNDLALTQYYGRQSQ
jgi:type IV secretion system protein VirB10